jgi:hypothetical protein
MNQGIPPHSACFFTGNCRNAAQRHHTRTEERFAIADRAGETASTSTNIDQM